MRLSDRARAATLDLSCQHAIQWSTPKSCLLMPTLKILPLQLLQPCSINHKRKVIVTVYTNLDGFPIKGTMHEFMCLLLLLITKKIMTL